MRMNKFRIHVLFGVVITTIPIFSNEMPAPLHPSVTYIAKPALTIGNTNFRCEKWLNMAPFSPIGGLMAISDQNCGISLHSSETGKVIRRLEARGRIWGASVFSPDGMLLATLGDKIYIWELASGKEIWALDDKNFMSGVGAIAFSPDGKTLASGAQDKIIRLWDIATGKERLQMNGCQDEINCLSYSPDGTCLASSDGKYGQHTIHLWDPVGGNEQYSLRGHNSRIARITFSPDSKILASADDKTLHFWDVGTGKERFDVKAAAGGVNSLKFSPSGAIIACIGEMEDHAGRQCVTLWNVNTGTQIRAIKPSLAGVTWVMFSPDEKTLVLGGNRPERTDLEYWDTQSGDMLHQKEGHTNEVSKIMFSPDGARLLTHSREDQSFRAWNLTTGKRLQKIESWSSKFAVSSDHKLLAIFEDENFHLWDLVTGKQRFEVQVKNSFILSSAFSSDSSTLATVFADGIVRVWDVASGRESQRWMAPGSLASAISFTVDRKKIAVAGYMMGIGKNERDKGMLDVWDVAAQTTSTITRDLPGRISIIQFKQDGQGLACGIDLNFPFFCDIGSGKQWPAPPGDQYYFTGMELAPDCRVCAFGSEEDTILLWDVHNGKEFLRLCGTAKAKTSKYLPVLPDDPAFCGIKVQPDGIRCLKFSPDGRRLATCHHSDGMIRIWDVATMKLCFQLLAKAEVIAFSQNGKKLATAGYDTTVLVWDLDVAEARKPDNRPALDSDHDHKGP